MRIAAQRFLGPQPDRAQSLAYLVVRIGLGRGQSKLPHWRRQDVIDLVERVVHLKGILKDRLYILAKLLPLLLLQVVYIAALVEHLAGTGIEHPEQHAGDRGLAAAGLAGNRGKGGPVSVNRQRKIVNSYRLDTGPEALAAAAKNLAQMARLKKRGHRRPPHATNTTLSGRGRPFSR